MAYPIVGAYSATASTHVTAVECHKQVRSWRLLRFLVELLIPTCHCTFLEDQDVKQAKRLRSYPHSRVNMIDHSTPITGTIFGYRGGKVSFCIQTNSKSTIPVLLLELAVPTNILAKEMRGGALRIVLEGLGVGLGHGTTLLSTPLWNMYCNGKKVGYAVKRQPSRSDMEALKLMNEVDVGAGLISGKECLKYWNGEEDDHELMYLRANFHRVCDSSNSESFHVIDPEGHIGQELSIFFYR